MHLNAVHHTRALDLLRSIPDSAIDMIYTDPPFGTGDVQTMTRKAAGNVVSKIAYSDKFSNYLEFLEPHLIEMHRILKNTGTMYLHLDWRWVHYAKVKCDEIFGYDNFLNEIVWSYNFGGRGKDRWPAKHDTILVYAKKLGEHTFNWNDIDRIPYAAPELQYVGRSREEAEKRIASGQVPTDVWNMSIVGTASKERLGYPNQKPVKLIKRAIVASSNKGDVVLDPFVGSGTTAAAALEADRKFIVSDAGDDAIAIMQKRFASFDVKFLFDNTGEKNNG
jgi:site-specific DNA-methyltransferase (adenine-specific)